MKALLAAGAVAAVMFGTARAGAINRPLVYDDPPPGIVPVTIKLQSVLDASEAAIGRTEHKIITEVEEGTIGAYGLTGRYRKVYAGLHADDDSRQGVSLGPFTESFGRYQGQRWRHNENGITTVLQDTVRADENDALGFLGDTDNPKNDVTLLGEIAAPAPAYVVQVKRKNLEPFWSFYNVKTGLLERVEVGYKDHRVVYTYDDYRSANGIRTAWHTHHSDGNPGNEYDSRIQSDRYGVPVAGEDLSIPPTRTSFVRFPAGKAEVDLANDIELVSLIPEGIHAVFADPLVRVRINGQDMFMLLNSAESGMVLDDEKAKELGLTTYGPYDLDEKGHGYPTKSIIPLLQIGDLQMQDVYVKCRHVNRYEASGTLAVGEIGYDFLANAVVSIDYVHSKIKAYDPQQFVPPADAVPTPVNVDDGVAYVSAEIGKSGGDYFVLDTAYPITALFPSFWQAHPDDAQDQGKGREQNFRIFNSSDSKITATQLKAIYFGGVRFDEWLAYKFTDPSMFEGVNRDGVIGTDFLEYFNVFIDYPHRLIYFEPNERFKKSAVR